MKKLLILLFSFFFLYSPSVFAKDISDFSIEGMSVGDSLLDYMTEEEILKEIEKNIERYPYLKEPYKYVQINLDKEFQTYDFLSFFIKNNSTNQYVIDKNEKFTIELIRGAINFVEGFDNCILKRDEIEKILSDMFPNEPKEEYNYAHSADPSGNSFIDGIDFTFDSGAEIDIYCSNHEETFRLKKNWTEGLDVMISSVDTAFWLQDYK